MTRENRTMRIFMEERVYPSVQWRSTITINLYLRVIRGPDLKNTQHYTILSLTPVAFQI